MFGMMNAAQASCLELVKCTIKSEAAYLNVSDELADQCANKEIEL